MSWIHQLVDPRLGGGPWAGRDRGGDSARGASTRGGSSASTRGVPSASTRGVFSASARGAQGVPSSVHRGGSASGVCRVLAVGPGVLEAALEEAVLSGSESFRGPGGTLSSGGLPWCALWREEADGAGAAPRRWVTTGGDTLLRTAAPAWWAAVAADGLRAWGASVGGDRLGWFPCVAREAPGDESESVPAGQARGQRAAGSGGSQWARSSRLVTMETGLRGRTLALVPRWGGVLLVTRTALLFAGPELSVRALQGGFDHLAGVCPMGEPRA